LLKFRATRNQNRRKIALWSIFAFIGLAGFMQVIPYGRARTPTPSTNPFQWRSPEAQALAKAACYDCHSGEPRWWWAVKIAPFSWLAQRDRDRAQRQMNFSAWNGRVTAPRVQLALDGAMPPWYYTLVHREARLTESQKQTLMRGFEASLEGQASTPQGPTGPRR